MKPIYQSALTILILVTISVRATAAVHPIDDATAKKLEEVFAKANPNAGWKIGKSQAFRVDLNKNTLHDVEFASFSANKKPQIQFALFSAKDHSLLQTFPNSELAVTVVFGFSKINSVTFKDVNGDGTLDILMLATYFDSRPVQGDGVGGHDTKIGLVYLSKGDTYVINDDCGEDANAKSLRTLETCARRLPKN